MLQKIHLLFAFALAFPAASYGLVGGPFDNGDYSQQLDTAGIYQAALRFPNGQGFCQFGTNVDITSYIDVAQSSGGQGGSSAGTRSTVFSYLNRSVIYYKGLTFLGQAWGTVDMTSKRIEGITNGNSDVSTTTQQNTGGGGTTAASVSSVNTLVANGARSFTCNTAWTAKIQPYGPVLRFRGDGTLSVLNPDGIAQMTTAVNALLALVATASPPLPAGATVPTFNGILQNINQIATGIAAVPTGPLADVIPKVTNQLTFDNSDTVHLRVSGVRKYFLGRQ